MVRALLIIILSVAGCTHADRNPVPSGAPPASFPGAPRRDLEVLIPAAGIELKGTLSVPPLAAEAAAPGVLLVHGSGPHDRDSKLGAQLGMQFGFEIPVFSELAEALVEAGFIVLRYDKRTCGPFNGCANNGYPALGPYTSVQAFVDDAGSALDWLRARPEVAKDAVFYLGYSQGAQFAPQLLNERPWLNGGVVLAGPFRPIDAMVGAQAALSRRLLEQLGFGKDEIDRQLADQEAAADALSRLRAGEHDGSPILGVNASFWQSWMQLGDAVPGLIPRVRQPMLVISGSYDWNVPPHENDLWKEAFGELRRNPGHVNIVISCVSHALNCIRQSNWQEIAPADFGKHVSAQLLGEITAFLTRLR